MSAVKKEQVSEQTFTMLKEAGANVEVSYYVVHSSEPVKALKSAFKRRDNEMVLTVDTILLHHKADTKMGEIEAICRHICKEKPTTLGDLREKVKQMCSAGFTSVDSGTAVSYIPKLIDSGCLVELI